MPVSNRFSAAEKQAKRRNYTRENRELWKHLGFRMLSATVHDDDREEVLAELEVRRAERLVAFANDKDTGIATLVQIGRRNLNPPDSPKEMSAFGVANKNLDNYLEIDTCINMAKKAHTAFRNTSGNIDRAADDVSKQRMYAREVAYGNLAAAWFKLAKAKAARGHSNTIFELKEHW